MKARTILATAAPTERERDAERKRKDRRQAREVLIPQCADRARRAALEADDIAWLMYYFGPSSEVRDPFWYEFTSQQREMIFAIRNAIVFGGDQALAASRGEGKTTICERILTKYTLEGRLSYSVLLAASGPMADNSLDAIKSSIEENPLLLEDYPEVCVPVQALENTPNRAHYQIVSGLRHDNGEPYTCAASKFVWCGQEIIFPDVPGSPSAKAIIAARGLDAAIRGLKKKGRRPQLAVIDDPDTEETARSEEQAEKLEKRIDRGIAGLGGQQKGVARVMLTTLQSRVSASFKYTDPMQKPSMKGRRFRFLVKPPARVDLWEQYVQQRQAEFQAFALGQSNDEHCRKSHQFYLDNRAAMDEDAVVANKNRFNGETLPDGSHVEVSALQRYYNEVAKIGQESVDTEYNNDPPEESGPIESGISAHRIQKQLSGFARTVVPPGCTKITVGIDCRKIALHWVARAWRPDGSGFTIDYGVFEITGTTYGSDVGVDIALKRALLALVEELKAKIYATTDGEVLPISRMLVDAGWRTKAVYSTCAQVGSLLWPVMGFGHSAGCVSANFSEVQRNTLDRRPGDGYFLSRKGKLWLVCADADSWKAWEHDRWMTAPGNPGCMTIYGNRLATERQDRLSADEKAHHSYARHITNEIEVEEPYRGTIRRRWKAKSDNTHWLDASYYSDVAASMEGIRILQIIKSDEKQSASNPANKMTLGQLAKKR